MKTFTLILMTGVLVFFIWILGFRSVRPLVLQYEAQSFPSTQGQILSSEVTKTYGSKGRVYYHASFRYAYAVNGQSYTGWRNRYDGHPNDWAGANALVQECPRGSTVLVYYNPANPEDAVLSTRVDDKDVMAVFFTTPMCLFILWALLRLARQQGWPWSRQQVAGGVKLIEDLRLIRVRLPRRQASSVALLTMIALFFVAAAVMAYGFPLTPPLVLGGWLLAGVLAGGGSVYGWFFVVARSGREDLVIDEGSRTIRLPLTYGRRLETRLGFAEFAAVVLDKIEHQGRRGSTYYTYAVLLEKKDGILERLIELNQSRAEGLAEWLKAKLGIGGGGGVQTLNREANDE